VIVPNSLSIFSSAAFSPLPIVPFQEVSFEGSVSGTSSTSSGNNSVP